MTGTRIPRRVEWAVRVLDVAARDHVLEIGCGAGVAVSLICDRLGTGRIAAIDRSATAIKRATSRNAEHVASGKASFAQVDLAELAPSRTRYDTIFALNVNLFWVRAAAAEIGIVKRLLRRDGVLYLFYETPGADRTGQVAAAVARNLTENGFVTETLAGSAPTLVCVMARPATG